jgi:hypothetical protein
MSYRLDEGNGACTYFLGVEDDGCHSLLKYAPVSESARILECIARSLNAIVIERTMVQGEVIDKQCATANSSNNDGDDNDVPDGHHSKAEISRNGKISRVAESPVFRFDIKTAHGFEDKKTDEFEETRLVLEAYTRCEVTIHRIETHMLETSPLSLMELANGTESGSSVDDVTQGVLNVELNGSINVVSSSSPSSDPNENKHPETNLSPPPIIGLGHSEQPGRAWGVGGGSGRRRMFGGTFWLWACVPNLFGRKSERRESAFDARLGRRAVIRQPGVCGEALRTGGQEGEVQERNYDNGRDGDL